MNRLTLAGLLICLGASEASAQQPVVVPVRPPIPASQYGFGGYPVTAPPVVPRPRWMFTDSPNVFNYDSGDYLLGGFDGPARAQGSFTMGLPPGSRPAACQSCQPWAIVPPQPVIVIFDVVKP